MNALNIMWLLNEVDVNTNIEVKYVRSKSIDWIEIDTNDFSFNIDEYGSCTLRQGGFVSHEKDAEHWVKVKSWVKSYLSIIM